MNDFYDAFELSPVPAPGPDAVAPEPFRGIYGMPTFVTIPTAELAASVAFADAMADGVTPGSSEANSLAEQHRALFSASFFPLTIGMQVCLGRMYEADQDFASHYNRIRPGLADWLRQVIDAGARAVGIDPDTATWQ